MKMETAMNDSHTAELLVKEKLKGRVVFVHEYHTWYYYQNGVWKKDISSYTENIVKDFLLEKVNYYESKMTEEDEGNNSIYYSFFKYYNQCRNHQKFVAILQQARILLTVSINDFNKDETLINLKNGTYDLKLKVFRPHCSDDLLTLQMNCSYDPKAKCDKWLEFIEAVDVSNSNFLQVISGMNLLGKNELEKMFLFYGVTHTGKSTFTESICHLFGSYAEKTDNQTFLDSREGKIRNDIAKLKDSRFVLCSELKEGAKLDVAIIKAITGNDVMSVRFLNKEFFNFAVTFYVWLTSNFFPTIDGEDDALWRRLIVVPFKRKFDNPDSKFKDFFKRDEEEKSGIFNWVLVGLEIFLKEGLSIPEEIKMATNEKRLDRVGILGLGEFVAKECVVSDGCEMQRSKFYSSYVEFCKNKNFKAEPRHIVFLAVQTAGFAISRATKGVYKGEYVIEGIMWVGKPKVIQIDRSDVE